MCLQLSCTHVNLLGTSNENIHQNPRSLQGLKFWDCKSPEPLCTPYPHSLPLISVLRSLSLLIKIPVCIERGRWVFEDKESLPPPQLPAVGINFFSSP